ncbi:aminoglycoside phosphotransferase family protein [Devosia neptuniae]|uniref:Aminoglycoside phosphotransferase family protein n=1 Tax=Devosia neptuniae TaxID=191302 RepID=A0ABY6CBX8_9HYPH|nr:aminoglycoside phosphotransferase family protein [Devosia neptuniae]UXN68622.1 aminoglycoside phosphotransferase family protein [Devosia neptuniae]
MSQNLSPDITARVEKLLGWTPERWRPVFGGYTPAARYAVAAGEHTGFVKIATTEISARQVNSEIIAYAGISGPFVPRLLGAEPHPTTPILIIEDLSSATWPPPWTDELLGRVLDTIAEMHRTPSMLAHGGLLHGREAGWPSVAAKPDPFLSLGLVSSQWLERALPTLLAAEAACPLAGDALTHLDLRSDNLCVTAEGVKIIDWAEACRSDPGVDLGFFLPSLAYEGGPLPETILPERADVAATVAGFFAARAGLPDIPLSPFVRRVQREQLSTALPWAIRALGLPQS